ncbi:MAG: hypothetical protein NT069_29650 [Planctomycetota bacterium]|nr:hypothetical protein [Planctomycetota bacterium]
MLNRMFSFAILSLALLAAGPAVAAKDAKEADEPLHDGKVVSVSGHDLVMTNKDGKEHTHTLTKEAKVTCDAKACKLSDLKAGLKIRVTTKNGDKKTATHVEALDKDAMFANTHDGKVVSVSGDTLKMTGKDGKEHSHTLAAHAAICCDGKECKVSELKAGMKIRVTTKANDKHVLTVIEAIDKDAEFGT